MIINIDACSLDEAIGLLIDDNPEFEGVEMLKKPTNDIDDSAYESLGFVFYYMCKKPGENINQTQTKVIDFPFSGTKKWETRYLVVNRFNKLLVPTAKDLKFKADAVKEARLYTNEKYESSYVVLGKSLIGSDRTQARVDYKPAPSQEDGVWKFIM